MTGRRNQSKKQVIVGEDRVGPGPRGATVRSDTQPMDWDARCHRRRARGRRSGRNASIHRSHPRVSALWEGPEYISPDEQLRTSQFVARCRTVSSRVADRKKGAFCAISDISPLIILRRACETASQQSLHDIKVTTHRYTAGTTQRRLRYVLGFRFRHQLAPEWPAAVSRTSIWMF